MPTPHIKPLNNLSDSEAFGKTVLMPGDPLRSQFIAENFLENPVLVNNVRGIQGYTGTYKGVKVSVMASGMGIPSIGIYSHELYSSFGVENIIRVGSAGVFNDKLQLRDIVIAMGASTNSNFVDQFECAGNLSIIADYDLMSTAIECSKKLNQDVKVGNVLSSDKFYDDRSDVMDNWNKMGILAVEMEAAALYLNATRLGKRALAIMTVSDKPLTGEETTAEERQTTFTQMMELALYTAVAMENK